MSFCLFNLQTPLNGISTLFRLSYKHSSLKTSPIYTFPSLFAGMSICLLYFSSCLCSFFLSTWVSVYLSNPKHAGSKCVSINRPCKKTPCYPFRGIVKAEEKARVNVQASPPTHGHAPISANVFCAVFPRHRDAPGVRHVCTQSRCGVSLEWRCGGRKDRGSEGLGDGGGEGYLDIS